MQILLIHPNYHFGGAEIAGNSPPAWAAYLTGALLGCLKAFLKSAFGRKFYDLGKVGYWGPQSKKRVDFHFDTSRQRSAAETADWTAAADRSRKARAWTPPPLACGGGTQQLEQQDQCGADRPH